MIICSFSPSVPVPEAMKPAHFMHVLVAEDDFANRAAGQTEEHDNLNEREATAFGLGSGLGEAPLVGRGVSGGSCGAIDGDPVDPV